MKQRAIARLKKTKNWILVTLDNEEAPVYAFDISRLQNKEDVRHVVLHNLKAEIEGALTELFRFGKEKIDAHNIEATKEARSKALAEFAKDEAPGRRSLFQRQSRIRQRDRRTRSLPQALRIS
jgi:hypothetical protein